MKSLISYQGWVFGELLLSGRRWNLAQNNLPPISPSLELQEPFCTPILHGQAQVPGDQSCAHPELSISP